jgi:nucleoside-diphosphate-sugar epimerase
MNLLITGAGGFFGNYAVAAALAQGHRVRALLRPAADAEALRWRDHPRLELARLDLRAAAGIDRLLAGIDAVLHLAAAASGSLYDQLAATVVGTEHLLDAMHRCGVDRMVHVGTLAVYGYRHLPRGALVDEATPLERDLERRDAYTQAKLYQERLVRDRATVAGWRLTVLRPGVMFGRDRLFNAHIGAQIGADRWLRIGARATIPLCYVENCAEALVLAAERDAAAGQVLNLVDDACPTQRAYVAAVQRRMQPSPRVIAVPWPAMRAAAALAEGVNRHLLSGRLPLPGILIPARLHARCKPFAYSNRRAREVLGWQPRFGLAAALDRCFGSEPLPAFGCAGSAADSVTDLATARS